MELLRARDHFGLRDVGRIKRVDLLHAHASDHRANGKGSALLGTVLARDDQPFKRGGGRTFPDLYPGAGFYILYNIFFDHARVWLSTIVLNILTNSSTDVCTFT